MLSSLFGDLGSLREIRRRSDSSADLPDNGFAATALMESVATEVNERGQMVDRHVRDLVVMGSPAQAIRDHFAATRADLETANRQLTLLDPSGVWAPAVIKALSDAGGQPVERLHLRENTTLRTLAMIERTTLVRRHEDALRIYHADVRAPGHDSAEIPVALMERSHMTAVIVGPMQPHAIDTLLASLNDATHLTTWRCPNLLFMLPPNAAWIARKIGLIGWSPQIQVHVIDEPLISASVVWNALLSTWNRVKLQPAWQPVAPAALRVGRDALDPARLHQALAELLPVEGLLGCAAVDATTGLVLARELREDQPVDMDLAAAACAQLLRAHRSAAASMGLTDPLEECMCGAGSRQQIVRVLTRHPDVFIVALLDRHRTNLALARYKLMELDKNVL